MLCLERKKGCLAHRLERLRHSRHSRLADRRGAREGGGLAAEEVLEEEHLQRTHPRFVGIVYGFGVLSAQNLPICPLTG